MIVNGEESESNGLPAANGSKPKHAQLAELLDPEFRRLDPETPIPSVTALMDRFQVSQGTVVHALRHLRTRGLVVKPHGKKRLVTVGTKKRDSSVFNVLLLRSQWSSPDYDSMSYALLEEANRQRLHLEILTYGTAWRADLASAIKSQDALIVLPSSSDSPRLFSLIEESHLPSVMLWEEPPLRDMMGVADDDEAVGRMAAQHLMSLGHKSVVAFLSEPPLSGMKRRLAGWEDAMRAAGETNPSRLVIDCSVEPGNDAIVGSYEKLRRWLYQNGSSLPGTAVFCLCWTGALGMLRALREVGIEVPRDVSILSHGGENRLCEFTNPALSVIQCSVAESARQSLSLLKDACLGNKSRQRVILLPPSLIERESAQPFHRSSTPSP